MNTELATIPDKQLNEVLRNSLYPGASDMALELVKSYCKATNYDIMLKPVHIVPIWNNKVGKMVDTVMPGIGSYRITASRTGQYLGVSEPVYGPLVTHNFNGFSFSFPEWCKITVKRKVGTIIGEYTALEYWLENYAAKGGPEKSIAPNAMWQKRPYGQIAKCAEAQALRKAFPEVGSQPTAEELEGKVLNDEIILNPIPASAAVMPLEKLLAAIKTMMVEDFKSIDAKAYNDSEKATIRAACAERKKAILAAPIEGEVVAPSGAQAPPDDTNWQDLINNSQSQEELKAVEASIPKDRLADFAEVIAEQYDFLRGLKDENI